MMRSGFGGKRGVLSSRSSGLQTILDKAGSKHGLIRAIGGDDILTWIDATKTSNTLDAVLTNSTIDTIEGTESTIGTNAPTTVFSSVLNSTAYSFNGDETLKWSTNFFPASQKLATIASRYCITSSLTDHIVFELGNASGYSAINGGLVQGVVRSGSANTPTIWCGIGDAGSLDTFSWGTEATQNLALSVVSTYDTNANPDAAINYYDGERLPAGDGANDGKDTPHNIDRANVPYLGARNNGAGIPLNGHISDFVIITRKLTDSEASRLSLALT